MTERPNDVLSCVKADVRMASVLAGATSAGCHLHLTTSIALEFEGHLRTRMYHFA